MKTSDAEFLSLMWEFYRCPTTGRVLLSLPKDDKVMCGCGRSNPKVWQERNEETGTHVVSFLTKATAQEYLSQREKDHLGGLCKGKNDE